MEEEHIQSNHRITRVTMVKINVPQQQYMKSLETGHGRTCILQKIDTNPSILAPFRNPAIDCQRDWNGMLPVPTLTDSKKSSVWVFIIMFVCVLFSSVFEFLLFIVLCMLLFALLAVLCVIPRGCMVFPPKGAWFSRRNRLLEIRKFCKTKF